jgi:hypothetical protein
LRAFFTGADLASRRLKRERGPAVGIGGFKKALRGVMAQIDSA